MRLTDHLDLLDLSLRPLRARGFDQQVPARILFHTYPSTVRIHHLRTRYCGCGSDIGALSVSAGAARVVDKRFRLLSFMGLHPDDDRILRSPFLPCRNSISPGTAVTVGTGRLHQATRKRQSRCERTSRTPIEQLNTAIFIVDDARFRTRFFDSLRSRGWIAGQHSCNRARANVAPDIRCDPAERSFPMTWDPPLLLYYRSQPAETT